MQEATRKGGDMIKLEDGTKIPCPHCGQPRTVRSTMGGQYVEFCANRKCYDDAYEILPERKIEPQRRIPFIGVFDFEIY